MSQILRKLLSIPFFTEIVMSGISFSSVAYEIFSSGEDFSFSSLLQFQTAIFAVLELFILAHASENIKMESGKIAQKIYASRWHEMKTGNKKIRLLLLNAMLRAAQPVKLSALGLTNMSYETFIGVSDDDH